LSGGTKEGHRITQDGWSAVQDLNAGCQKYEAGVLTSTLTYGHYTSAKNCNSIVFKSVNTVTVVEGCRMVVGRGLMIKV
jgi:hypothetical protein